ncbi:YadA-like family protein [Escherichia coli]|uniref:YadA-like family protein n=1 Tax=Escherichia coli TaxID=562 RepID=UPI00025C786B|nr:YadA-like family protein [Escherichia coli]EIH23035.1 YadA-like C-terminal domain protein [Escherichia coli 1.2264]MBZ9547810.1 YadA-like family protein [Escherichia coli]
MSEVKKHVSYSLTVAAMLSAAIVCQTAHADVNTPNITGEKNNTTTRFSGNIYGSENTVTSESNSLVVGNSNSVEGGYNNIVIGNSSTVKASGLIRKVGEDIVLDGYSVSLGNATRINGDSSVAIGLTSSVTGNDSVALGSHSSANGNNIVSVGSDTLKRRITNLAQGKDDHDAVNLMQMTSAVNREAGERIKSTNNLQNQLNTLSGQVITETRARTEGDVAALAAARAHSDENDKRTLVSANTYADQKETDINNRTDGLLATERQARTAGDTATLAAARTHSDENNKRTLISANTYADQKETDINNRTDGLLMTERQARIAGDAETLATAEAYSDAGDSLTLKQATAYSDISTRRALSEAYRYTDNKFRNLSNKIERAEKRLNAGIAGVTAISSIPYVAENSFSYGIGVGNYQNANAVAAGIQYKTSRNTNIRLNISWDSSHNTAIGAGVAGGW